MDQSEQYETRAEAEAAKAAGKPVDFGTVKGDDGMTDDERRLSTMERANAQTQPGAYPAGSVERDEARQGAQAHQDAIDGENAARYQDMKADELKAELTARNERRSNQGLDTLPLGGSKADLISRLVEDDRTDPARQ